MVAALMLKLMMPDGIAGNSSIGAPTLNGVSNIQGFFMEFIGAVFLQLVYLYFLENENAPENSDGFSVGAMFGMCVLSTNHFTGAMINPAKALGPLILSFKFWLIPLYLFAPVVGSISGYLIYNYMLLDLDTETTKIRKDRERAIKEKESQRKFKEDQEKKEKESNTGMNELQEGPRRTTGPHDITNNSFAEDEGIGNEKL